MDKVMLFSSPWGWMGIAESSKGIQAIVLPKRSERAVEADLRAQSNGLLQRGESARLDIARRQLLDYLAGTRHTFDMPLDLSQGTVFQRQVWRVLLRVPYGKLRSYQWVAARVGGPQYARAVGNAVGANPIPVVIPCHRIVAQDATLGGFSGAIHEAQVAVAGGNIVHAGEQIADGLWLERYGFTSGFCRVPSAINHRFFDILMRAVIQRVTSASVEVDGQVVGEIRHGLMVLLGVAKGDDESDVRYVVDKIRTLRMFSDEQGKMNRSLADVGGAVLLVSQFTLLGRTANGRRPSFDDAAPPEPAQRLYEQVATGLRESGTIVKTGIFASHMQVALINDGPVTFVLDSREGGVTRLKV